MKKLIILLLSGLIVTSAFAVAPKADKIRLADAGSIITATEVEGALQENRTALDLNTTHRSSTGEDHTYIDQDVTSGSTPTFTNTNFTEATDKNYVTDAQQAVIVNTSGTNTGDVTVTDSDELDLTLTGQDLTATLKAGSIDETKLDASVNASLDLADSAIQTETDPLSLHLDGTNSPTATIDWNNQDLTGVKDLSAATFNSGTLSGNNTGDQDLINRFSSTITYSGNFVDTVTNNSIVTTYTNDGDKYTSWTDGTNTWTPVYDGTSGLLTSIGVT